MEKQVYLLTTQFGRFMANRTHERKNPLLQLLRGESLPAYAKLYPIPSLSILGHFGGAEMESQQIPVHKEICRTVWPIGGACL